MTANNPPRQDGGLIATATGCTDAILADSRTVCFCKNLRLVGALLAARPGIRGQLRVLQTKSFWFATQMVGFGDFGISVAHLKLCSRGGIQNSLYIYKYDHIELDAHE